MATCYWKSHCGMKYPRTTLLGDLLQVFFETSLRKTSELQTNRKKSEFGPKKLKIPDFVADFFGSPEKISISDSTLEVE